MKTESGGGPQGRTRRCAATGETAPEGELVRFVLSPEGVIVPDVAARLPGRGVWVRASADHLRQAIKRNGFSRGLKAPATTPSDLVERTEALLARRCLDLLGIALRARALAVGGAKAEQAIRDEKPGALIEASDGAADGRLKLVRLAFGLWGEEPDLVGCFNSTELGVALGRDRVVHVVMLQGSLAHRWTAEVSRLAGFRAITPASWR